MTLRMLKGKIHRAVVTQAELNYVGSITVDTTLLEAAGILEYEMVQIVDVENGNRFETYTIAGEADSGMIWVYSIFNLSNMRIALVLISFSFAMMAPSRVSKTTYSL